MFQNYQNNSPQPEFKRTKVGERRAKKAKIRALQAQENKPVLLLEKNIKEGWYRATTISVAEYPSSYNPEETMQTFIYELQSIDDPTLPPISMKFNYFYRKLQTDELDDALAAYGLDTLDWPDLQGLTEIVKIEYDHQAPPEKDFGHMRERKLEALPLKLRNDEEVPF